MTVVRDRLTSRLQGEAPWNVRLGHGTSVFFDFGTPEPSDVPGGPMRGVNQLWIYTASWRLFDGIGAGAGSGDGADEMETALHKCLNRRVSKVDLDAYLNLSIEFSGPPMNFATLRESTRDDAWTFFEGEISYSLTRDGSFLRESRVDSG